MKYIALIAAEDKEVEAILNIMESVVCEQIYNLNVYLGKIKGKDCLLTKAGIGKVNAGRTAQIIIDKFNVSAVINIGAAGATDEELKIGDIVISSGLVQYDFDVTAFGREQGFIPEVGKIFEPDNKLVLLCEKVAKLSGISYKIGCIATGDRFVNTADEKLGVNKEFGALCVEMEGAAIAHVCMLCDVPFVVIRSISDEVVGEAKVNFEEFLETASIRCAELISSMVVSY